MIIKFWWALLKYETKPKKKLRRTYFPRAGSSLQKYVMWNLHKNADLTNFTNTIPNLNINFNVSKTQVLHNAILQSCSSIRIRSTYIVKMKLSFLQFSSTNNWYIPDVTNNLMFPCDILEANLFILFC